MKAAVKSPFSLFLLLYGAFALFSLLRRHFDIPLAPAVLDVIRFYRQTVEGVLNGIARLPLSEPQQDWVVLWIGVGRIVTRSYVLLTRETDHYDREYAWFRRLPFAPLTAMNRRIVRALKGRASWLHLAPSSTIVTFLWPLFLWPFLVSSTVTQRDRWRVPTGGTPHPSDQRMTELPPIGDELAPKFSKEETQVRPLYNTHVIMLSFLALQLAAVGILLLVNAALGKLVR